MLNTFLITASEIPVWIDLRSSEETPVWQPIGYWI